MMPTQTSVEELRRRFPALAGPWAFMDNAGGSQVPAVVADAVRDYMLSRYVQVGGLYPASVAATDTVARAHSMVETLMGADDAGRVIIGASSSALCRMLSDVYAEVLGPGDEVVVAETGHEANVFPWLSLANRGVSVRVWKGEMGTGRLRSEDLKALLSARTRIVAFPHVSNILGAVEDVHTFTQVAHDAGARVVLDSVAYAPHRMMSVSDWGVDWCVFSCYKVFAPHMAALFGRHEALAEVTGRNHPFIPKEKIPGKFELGGVPHESCAGLVALESYFCEVASRSSFDRQTVAAAFSVMEELEQPLTERLIGFLQGRDGARIVGPATAGRERVATVSFIKEGVKSEDIVRHLLNHQVGIKHGNFYSVRLLEHLGIDVDDGVARVSFAHYNTHEEVDRLLAGLGEIV